MHAALFFLSHMIESAKKAPSIRCEKNLIFCGFFKQLLSKITKSNTLMSCAISKIKKIYIYIHTHTNYIISYLIITSINFSNSESSLLHGFVNCSNRNTMVSILPMNVAKITWQRQLAAPRNLMSVHNKSH